MRGVRITCPNCGRILGDTNQSIKATLNCRGCKKAVQVRMQIVSCADYLHDNKENDEHAVAEGE